MNKRAILLLLLLGLAAMGLLARTGGAVPLAQAAPLPTPHVERWVIAGGGGEQISGDLQLRSSIGQPLAGLSFGLAPDYDLCSGFWCSLALRAHFYLPLISR